MSDLQGPVGLPGLTHQIEQLAAQGYRIVFRGETSAQLVRAKSFSLFWFLFWTIPSFGILFWVYLAYYLAKRDSVVYLRLAERPVRRGTWR